jgi:hypothetical protein
MPEVTIHQVFDVVPQQHQSGQATKAETLYRRYGG